MNLLTGQLKFRVHRKQTHTDKYLSFDGYNPNNHKEGVVRTLFNGANTTCNQEFIKDEFNHVQEILLQNRYPEKCISNLKQNNT